MLSNDEELERRNENSVTDWDYEKCRCQNNGDYCDYCLMFQESEEERKSDAR